MVVVTHAMSFARRVADVVHVFDHGVVVESGPPSLVLDNPTQEATRRFLTETIAA
jgi:polar amino acid transport system ATP-binding protein